MRRAFSILELMVSVAIVAVLASIAVPQMQEMALKAKRAEAPTNLRGISDASVAYHATANVYLDSGFNPSLPGLNASLRDWRTNRAGWSTLGWAPDGRVRCIYRLNDTGYAEAMCDVDNDNDVALLEYHYPAATTPGQLLDYYPDYY